ncbi:flagellar basal-body rod protein FlgF [Desulfovibrionales bacterium]
MQESSYSATFGALTQQYRLDVIANNLANVNTTGFKADKLAFRDTFRRYAHDLINPNQTIEQEVPWPRSFLLAQPRIAERVVDLSQGSFKSTGNPLDMAIAGEGFFRLQTPQGEALTRKGVYHLSAEGYVVDEQGNQLLGEGGPLQIPDGGSIIIQGDGTLTVNGEIIDQISLVTVEDQKVLEKIGNSLFRIKNNSGAQPIPVEESSIEQGVLETANVEVVTEMVNMIETMRAFEAYQKMITGTFEQDKKAITEVGAASR